MTSDEISDICIEAAHYAQNSVGPGHSEVTYETIILNFLYDRRVPVRRQVRFYEIVANDTIQTGILDLEVDRSVLLELKSNLTDITEDHITQLERYMRSAQKNYQNRPIIGMVLLFSKKRGLLIFREIVK